MVLVLAVAVVVVAADFVSVVTIRADLVVHPVIDIVVAVVVVVVVVVASKEHVVNLASGVVVPAVPSVASVVVVEPEPEPELAVAGAAELVSGAAVVPTIDHADYRPTLPSS